jgi:hypothetical protein
LVTTYKTTGHHNPEDHNRMLRRIFGPTAEEVIEDCKKTA